MEDALLGVRVPVGLRHVEPHAAAGAYLELMDDEVDPGGVEPLRVAGGVRPRRPELFRRRIERPREHEGAPRARIGGARTRLHRLEKFAEAGVPFPRPLFPAPRPPP